MNNNLEKLKEIKGFLDGYNEDFKYIVNVETNPSTNYAECVIHEPGESPKLIKIEYEPFLYIKDLDKLGIKLYDGYSESYLESLRKKYGIKIKKLETGKHDRLEQGYCYMYSSTKSFNNILTYLKDGGVNLFEKQYDEKGRPIRNNRGEYVYPNRDLMYTIKTTEQFFISTQSRLYKGFEKYNDIHKLTFDIETTGLRYEISRIFAIGIRDNRGFNKIIEVDSFNDDASEIKLIQDFFNTIEYIKPSIISGYNSEMFDFDFILGRAGILNMELTELPTSFNGSYTLKRRTNTSVKYGNTADKYTSTEMWGYSVIDILHAAKRTAAINTEIKSTSLKYIAKFEKIAKENRVYIKGEDNSIGKIFTVPRMFIIDKKSNYIEIPHIHYDISLKLFRLQEKKNEIPSEEYQQLRKLYLQNNPDFHDWLKTINNLEGVLSFIDGKNLVRRYLLDDLWETEQVDELYNQSSFMLAKIVPTTYQRICTMGTAAIWNLLLTAWSYENDIAIPISDTMERFSGGLARCYKVGYTERVKKIDYGSLYPMIQLTDNVFPIFDISGVIKKMLLYLTTTRNVYKKLANGTDLNESEKELFKEIDKSLYDKYDSNKLESEDKAMFKIKQLPIKILNNSLFGALGSNISFNWSDNNCAARITCSGRLHLRHAIFWFGKYGCVPLLAVTDGINFNYPKKTKIKIDDNIELIEEFEEDVNLMWKFNGKRGMDALIEKYNKEEMKPPFMSVDDDGDAIATLNLSRINYANLVLIKDKKTGDLVEKIKLTGNTIKSKTMPEYIEDFIDKGLDMILHGKGSEFISYYYDYCDDIRYMRIPLKKIASKSKVKIKLKEYLNRGLDKNGREKGMQAHMELLIEERNKLAEKLFNEHKVNLNITNDEISLDEKKRLIADYMPPEPELDSVVYYVNCGYRKSHGDSGTIKDKDTGVERFVGKLINNNDLIENPNMLGEYNFAKYLDAFNSKVESLLVGFSPEIRDRILVKLDKNDDLQKEMFTNDELKLKNYNNDDLEESYYLEDAEVDFWIKTCYDPNLTWDGFKLNDENRIKFDLAFNEYKQVLNILNEKMKASGRQEIKTVNENHSPNDLVLIKNADKYYVAVYNGNSYQIIRSNVENVLNKQFN